jgi:hypothetical protein
MPSALPTIQVGVLRSEGDRLPLNICALLLGLARYLDGAPSGNLFDPPTDRSYSGTDHPYEQGDSGRPHDATSPVPDISHHIAPTTLRASDYAYPYEEIHARLRGPRLTSFREKASRNAAEMKLAGERAGSC